MLVAVTGGNGFIAGHVVQQLLESEGEVEVAATVRSSAAAAAIADLAHAAARLRVHRVTDLADAAALAAVFQGADAVVHLATPVLIELPPGADAETELVAPAVAFTRAVLAAALATPSVKTVVVTSSAGAVTEGPQFGKKLDETMWNTDSSATRNPYYFAKVCAERAAWEFKEQHPECNFKLITLLPSFVIGPALTKSLSLSNTAIQSIVSGILPFRLSISWPYVDVRDVAAVHVAMVKNAEHVQEGRYLVASGYITSMDEVCTWISDAHPEFEKVPKALVPKSVQWLVSFLRKPGEGRYLRQNLVSAGSDVGYNFDTSKLKNALPEIKFRSVRETVEATVQDLRMWGHI